MGNKHNWKFQSIGGSVRVDICSGEDIAHLGELDQKLWTVLSCPAKGLEFNQDTLSYLDADGDGKIRVKEVVAAAEWLCSVIKDRDSLLKGESSLPLDNIDTDNPEGLRLYNSARQILSNLSLEKNSISVGDTSDSVAIFKNTKFNGDGIITEQSLDDEALKATLRDCITATGAKEDRSGLPGIDASQVEDFYAALADYSAWVKEGVDGGVAIKPYGDATAEAYAAFEAVRAKVDDFFMRCRLVRFDDACLSAVNFTPDKMGEIAGRNLSEGDDAIAVCPLARPDAEGTLPFDAVNPAWQKEFSAFRTLVLDKELPAGSRFLTEDGWRTVASRLEAYGKWMSARKGGNVESLGIDRVNALLEENARTALLDAIARDTALKAETESIDAVNKLVHYYRDFYKFLMNFIVFKDFYSIRNGERAVFEIGELYIDQRCCRLCLKVEDMGKHSDMAGQSGMFLIYCNCKSKVRNETMDIVAVLTGGRTASLKVGTNALFYDRGGQDWDAVVTKIVDNPISIRQAFWSPYRKFFNFCTEKLQKSASEKDAKLAEGMKAKVETATLPKPDAAADANAKKAPFDIAKFAGIFAAIGMAFGYIGSVLKDIVAGVTTEPVWKTLLVIAGLLLVISGPACFLAWSKLRKRNLGPVLNANGWAINSALIVNSLFGATLTSVAKYPILKVRDPFARKKMPAWQKWLIAIAVFLVAAGCVLWFTDIIQIVRGWFCR